jgi:hypothetical protein
MIPPEYLNEPGVQPNINGPSPETFFEAVYQTFRKAEQNTRGSSERSYSIAGHPVRLRFAGSLLPPLITPALEHLSSAENIKPELTICIFDGFSTKSEMPSPPWSLENYAARGVIKAHGNEIKASFDLGTGVLNMLRRDTRTGIFWINDARLLPCGDSGAPLRIIFHWWLLEHKIQLLHAGAVGTDREGVLLVGKGGSGKSTSALACLHSGLKYAADDYCLLAAEPIPFVYSLYSSGKVNAADRIRFPLLEKALSNAEKLKEEKALYFFYKYFPEKISRGFALKAILIPHIAQTTETKVSPVSAAAALRALAPSTIFQFSDAGEAALRLIGTVVRKVPCYQLASGTDLSGIPRAIHDVLRNVSS